MQNVPIFTDLNDPSVIELLQAGKVGIIPTDTVYGLVGVASQPAAAGQVQAIKGRERKPGTLIAANIDQLVELGIKRRYVQAVEQFWPGAISVVLPTPPELTYLDSGLQSLAVRIPDVKDLLALLQKVGPLATTSANRPGEPTVGTIEAAKAIFGDRVAFYVDHGDLSGRPPSTIIRIVDDSIEVLRQGAVTIDETGRIR